MKRLLGLALPALLVAACGAPFQFDGDTGSAAVPLTASKLDTRLRAVLDKGPNGRTPGVAQSGDQIDVLIAAEPTAIAKLSKLGVHVRTVTSSGVMTARVPLDKVNAIAAIAEVHHVEVGKQVKPSNDLGNGAEGMKTPPALRSTGPGVPAHGGAGVVVGVLDSGIDYRHADFRNADGSTRIKALWDQSERTSQNTSMGRTYTQADIQKCIDNVPGAICRETDVNGHGTHVTGTAAGNGRAVSDAPGSPSQYQMAGVAPDSDIVFVKFDFDGDRNTDAAIIDGVSWIFQQAAALGKPCVVNLSLGSDYSPHDGSTLEERGLNDLTGPGKIIVAAAGNPGVNVPVDDVAGPNQNLWGWPLHGSGTVPPLGSSPGYSEITFNINPVPGASAGNYVFFNIWYEGNDTNQVQIITPTGKAYPSTVLTKGNRTFKTGGTAGCFNAAEGSLCVYNGGAGDELGTGSTNGDQDMYIEIGDGAGTVPAAGAWKIRIWGANSQPGTGKFHGWHGSSFGLFTSHPKYQDGFTNNAMTVGSPATAEKILSMGAYATKLTWPYQDLNGSCPDGQEPCNQAYNEGPLNYYDPFGIGDLAPFSARGPSRDNRPLPTVSAPGVGIVSSLSQDTLNYEKGLPPNQTYFIRTNRVYAGEKHSTLQGTSMASPHGTGAVALLLAKNRELTPTTARQALQSTAWHDAKTGPTANNDWGAGKIDVGSALAAVCESNADCGGGCCTNGACGACAPPPLPTPDCVSTRGASCATAPCCSGLTCGGKPNNKTCR